MCAALGSAQEQRLGARGGMVQAVLRAVGASGALVGHQCGYMGRVLDLRAAIEAAPVSGEHFLAIDHAHRLAGSRAASGCADMGVRDGVVVQVEAHVGRLVRAHRRRAPRRGRAARADASRWGFSSAKTSHTRAAAVLGTGPLGGLAHAPGQGLGVQIVEIAEAGERRRRRRARSESPVRSAPSRCRAPRPPGGAGSGSARPTPGACGWKRIASSTRSSTARAQVIVEQHPRHARRTT